MNFRDFFKIYSYTPLIDSRTFPLFSKNPDDLRRQVREWVKKGYLIPLKKGIYIFSDDYKKIKTSMMFIANYLVTPSYLSLEYALKYYDLIPERVTVFTSVTSKKTVSYKNSLGFFEYRSIKKNLFFGFNKGIDEGQDFFIALPEKAILDFFYLNKSHKGNFDEFESLRFQNLEIINLERLNTYKVKYPEGINKIANAFIEYIKQYKEKYRSL